MSWGREKKSKRKKGRKGVGGKKLEERILKRCLPFRAAKRRDGGRVAIRVEQRKANKGGKKVKVTLYWEGGGVETSKIKEKKRIIR